MIEEGSDDLSRGVWVSELHVHVDSSKVTQEVFRPFPVTSGLLSWVRHCLNLPSAYPLRMRQYTSVPSARAVLHCHSVWCPAPELARQLLCSLLLLWSECPLTTAFTVVVPRVLQRQWGRVSRSVNQLGPFKFLDMPPSIRPSLPIPAMLLHVPRHKRCLPSAASPSDRLDSTALPPDAKWHREQAELLRGLR